MKKWFVIPVMFLYLLAVSGIMIHIHYCGQTLESWSLYAKSGGCAEGECGDEEQEPDGCCENKVITSKVAQDQYFSASFKLKLADIDLDIIPTNNFQAFEDNYSPSSVLITSNQPNAPPGLWQNIPLYKLHSRIVYYG